MFVCFDLGNVIFRVNLNKFTDYLDELIIAKKRISPETEYSHLHTGWQFLCELQAAQDIGITTLERHLFTIYRNLFNETQVKDLMNAWFSTIEPSLLMFNFLTTLKNEGVKIAFLSNIGFDHLNHLQKTYPDFFENTISHFSCEVGARKPSIIYYQSFLTDHPEYKNALYVDDLIENLKIGKKQTFKTYHFDLETIEKMPISQQHIELKKLKSYIINGTNCDV